MRERKFDGCTWGIRVIQCGGVIKFKGRLWKIDDTPRPRCGTDPTPVPFPYDGRLDGKKAVVVEYTQHERMTGHSMMALHSCPPSAWPGDNCVDGVFVWDDFRLAEHL